MSPPQQSRQKQQRKRLTHGLAVGTAGRFIIEAVEGLCDLPVLPYLMPVKRTKQRQKTSPTILPKKSNMRL